MTTTRVLKGAVALGLAFQTPSDVGGPGKA
jgi:hypothetical protein